MFVRTAAEVESTELALPILIRVNVLGARAFAPASLIALVSGAYLVWDGPWSFADPWVVIGLVGVLLGVGLGIGFHAPHGARALQLARANDDATVLRDHLRRWVLVSRVEAVVIVLVIAVMVLKPGG